MLTSTVPKKSQLLHWLRLLRWRNLLLLWFTQWTVWQMVLQPFYQPGMSLLSPVVFWLLSSATVLIAAGGYAINDYFDVPIDVINKPQEVILDRYLPRRQAMVAYLLLSSLGLLLAAAVAWQAGRPEWLLLQLGCVLLLGWYSRTLKQKFVWGNLAVSLLSALSIVVLWLYEPGLRPYHALPPFLDEVLPNPVYILMVYASFAFLLTWMREIVKDLEDLEGDRAAGCRTLPIRWGVPKSILLVQVLGVQALLALLITGSALLYFNPGNWLGWYVSCCVCLPLLLWIININKKHTASQFHQSSTYLKLIMLAGIGSLFVYRFYYG